MRLLELKNLTEATLSAKELTKYPWRQTLFITKIQNKQPFELVDGSEIIIDPKEAQRFKKMFDSGTFVGSINFKSADGILMPLTKLQKTNEFVRQSTVSDAGTKTDKISNRGDVAEGILSAALFAKLKARADGEIEDITAKDLWAVVDSLRQVGDEQYTVTVKDAGKKAVNDMIVFTLILPRPAYLDFVNPNKRSLLKDETASAVAFANSEDNTEFSRHFYLNGKPDIIEIICDGGNPEKQKTSKVDIEVVVTDKQTGKRSRKRLDISLKARAKQFGQVGVGSTKEQNFFEKQQLLWGKFGLDLSAVQGKFNTVLAKQGLEPAITEVYRYAAKTMAELLSQDNSEDEYLYLKDLERGINYFATLDTPNVLLVNFERGGYEVLSFKDLAKKLSQVQLTAVYKDSLDHPRVDIIDADTGSILIQFRLKFTETERRNYVEKGPLLSELLGTKKKK